MCPPWLQYNLALFMDVHAHSTSKSNMCYCNQHDPSGELHRH